MLYPAHAFLLASLLWPAQPPDSTLIVKPQAFKTLVNPNCSHCVDEANRRAGELRPDDPILCWTRGYSDGGVIPIRFFLNEYRVISDSYGVFVYDPDAGYARGFAPSYQFSFHGWRNGVMVMRHHDGTLYSCLTGLAFEGPRKGDRLTPIPTLTSTWDKWIKRYPNAVAYRMFAKYQALELPTSEHSDSAASRRRPADPRLPAQDLVLGVNFGGMTKAYLLVKPFRLQSDSFGGERIVVLRDGQTAGAYKLLAHQPRAFKAPQPNQFGISPVDPGEPLPRGAPPLSPRRVTLREAPDGFRDEETGSSWDIAGRATDGELKGWTLEPLDSVVCKWFAWSAEYPQSALGRVAQERPNVLAKPDDGQSMRMVAGTAEFLRILPKPMATLKAVNPKGQTVTLLLEGEQEAKVWPVEPDAEVKVGGWWGRLEQFKAGDRVWVWLKLDRKKKPVSVCMIADELSEFDCHGSLRDAQTSEGKRYQAAEVKKRRKDQKEWLRGRWESEGLPATLTFHHVFSGELELMLDHETMRWARSLREGDIVYLSAEPPIKAVVKQAVPWRERTAVRLVVGELESTGLRLGQRLFLKMSPLPREIEESPYPPDLERPRSVEERVEWFLASTYCVCGVRKDTCTGQFYTLASCNPNGCGSPSATRRLIRQQIAEGKSDKEIWDLLIGDRGPMALKPHLLP
jgi:hypothetical protein